MIGNLSDTPIKVALELCMDVEITHKQPVLPT